MSEVLHTTEVWLQLHFMDVTGLRSSAVHPVIQSVISRSVKHDMTGWAAPGVREWPTLQLTDLEPPK